MSDEEHGGAEKKEAFLSRWSRLKQQAKEQPVSAPAPSRTPEKATSPPPELPPLEKLTLESDYRGFFHPKVDENLRRAALKKLFSDPHFNVMDGLDVYIEDYSKSDPLPAVLLAQLRQAQKILDWAGEQREGAGPPGAAEQAGPAGDKARIEVVAQEAASTSAPASDAPGNGAAEPSIPRAAA